MRKKEQIHKKKHIELKIAGGIVLAIIVIAVGGTMTLFGREIKIMNSISKLEDSPAYVMEIAEDYYFDEFLEAGGASTDEEVAVFLTQKISHGFYSVDVTDDGLACSTISANTADGSHIWGRTFDWTGSVPIIVRCTPQDGYSSVSTCDFQNITGSREIIPEGVANKMLAISALYVPMDGINSAGLCVADLEVNEGGMPKVDTEKPDLTVTTAIRLLLNKAATIEEAIELLKQYDIHASGTISHHLSIADATGASASIEFTKDGFTVVDTKTVTNFNLANGDICAGGESAQKRYETLCKVYEENKGILNRELLKDAMIQVSQSQGQWTTQWTIIYEENAGTIDYYFGGDYSKLYQVKAE